jgi:chemotaxis protein MotA
LACDWSPHRAACHAACRLSAGRTGSRSPRRKQGPVGLEKVETDEPFLAKGIRYVADGYDLEFIRDNLERDRDNFLMHLDEGGKIYRAIGDCTPAFGMVGTLIGMVQMMPT